MTQTTNRDDMDQYPMWWDAPVEHFPMWALMGMTAIYVAAKKFPAWAIVLIIAGCIVPWVYGIGAMVARFAY